jgi:hypothetical protein
MLVELLHYVTLWLNAFPPKGGVSSTISPRNIMTGVPFDFNKHCRLWFGSYVQTHEDPSPTNTQNARTVGAICLGPTGNLQGSHKNNESPDRSALDAQALPIPQEVIDRVNLLGKTQGQPELLTFYDRKGRLIGNDAKLDTPIAGVIDDVGTDAAPIIMPPDIILDAAESVIEPIEPDDEHIAEEETPDIEENPAIVHEDDNIVNEDPAIPIV